MAAVSCTISSHDTEGTRPRRDIEVKCRGTLRPGVSGFAESLVVIRPELLVLLDEVNQIIGNRLCVDSVHVSRLLLLVTTFQ